MWFYHLIRSSVSPAHATVWVAVQTVATVFGFIAAGVYVVLTYRLWREASRTNQTALMQQLMLEYDAKRDDVNTIRELLYARHQKKEDAIEAFRTAVHYGLQTGVMKQVDDSRYAVSRFFVKTRKLAKAGFLDRKLIAIALQRAAIEDVFLGMVDPLDQVITMKARGKVNVVDREFYTDLVRDLPELLS